MPANFLQAFSLMPPRSHWSNLAQQSATQVVTRVVSLGLSPLPSLHIVERDQAVPFYASDTKAITLGLPDPTTRKGQLFYFYLQYVLGGSGATELQNALEALLPLLVTGEVIRYLRHLLHTNEDSEWCQAQVGAVLAVQFARQDPGYARYLGIGPEVVRQSLIYLARLTASEQILPRIAVVSNEQLPHTPAFSPFDVADILLAQKHITAEQANKARVMCKPGENLSQMLGASAGVSSTALTDAQALMAEAKGAFAQFYPFELREYTEFVLRCLLAALERRDLPSFDETLELALGAMDPAQRQEREFFLTLTTTLYATDESLASAAAGTLAELYSTSAEPALLKALPASAARIQVGILHALEKVSVGAAQQHVVSFCLRALIDPATHWRVRAAAFRWLRIAAPDALDRTLRSFAQPTDPAVLAEAALAFRLGKDEQEANWGLQGLQSLLISTQGRNRRAALLALSGLSEDTPGLQRLAPLIPLIIPSLNDETDRVSRAALHALQALASVELDPMVISTIAADLSQLLTHKQLEIRQGATDFLGRLALASEQPDIDHLQALSRVLGDPEPQIRDRAAAVLINFADTAKPFLRDLAQGTAAHLAPGLLLAHLQLQIHAALLLLRMKDQEGRKRLEELLASLTFDYERLGKDLLGLSAALHSPVAADVPGLSEPAAERLRSLVDVASEEQAMLLLLALEVAGGLGKPDVMRVALKEMQNGTPEQRAQAHATALLALPEDAVARFRPWLEPSANGEQASVSPPSPPRLATVLAGLARHSSIFLRAVVVNTCGTLALDQSAETRQALLEVVQQATQDPEELVRAEAEIALARLPQPNAKENVMLSTIEKVLFLRTVPTFRPLDAEMLRPLAEACLVRHYQAGERIFNEGDPGDQLYVILNGRIALERMLTNGEVYRLGVLGPRQYFGEMAVLDEGPRSASAIADVNSTLLTLAREPFYQLGRQEPPLLAEVIRVLVSRLREMDARILSGT